MVASSSQPVVQVPVADQKDEQKPMVKKEEVAAPPVISSSPPVPEAKVLSKVEKIEYRDQDGNLLDEEQIQALEGKVEFKTKYETKTRVVDERGNEIAMPEGGWPAEVVGVAPPHPDVEGVDKETVKVEGGEALKEAEASRDGEKEAEQVKAKPASDGKDATVLKEL